MSQNFLDTEMHVYAPKMHSYGPMTKKEFGGVDRDRTDDLVIANDALSQLSYDPT